MLIQTLIKNGNKVAAVVPLDAEESVLRAEENLIDMGCELIHLRIDRRGLNPLKDLKLFTCYRLILKKQQPDLVITYTIKPNIYGGFACRVKKIPYAVNITGLGTSFQGDRLLRKLVVVMYKIALKKAKIVFFENVGNRDTMVDFGILDQRKTCVLPGAGVDLERFKYAKYPKDNGEIRFLFIGRVMKEKGVEELFIAMQMLKDDGLKCSLDIIGGFEEDYSERLRQYEEKGWLKYHGCQNDVRPFIENDHCYVLPSWHEGMANTNLECAAMGRPLITSNIHGCLESIIESKSGLTCERKNAVNLYQVMKKFIELPYSEKIQMGIEGRRHMEEAFDKRKVVQMTISKL
jgi:galacturonosyltransferase